MWDYKGLVAGRDPVAVETVCVQILLKKREALRGEPWPLSPPPVCVERADKDYGLGTSDLAKIRLERLGWSQNVLV
jgi:Fe2+ transport system protein FeoA